MKVRERKICFCLCNYGITDGNLLLRWRHDGDDNFYHVYDEA